MKHSAGEPSSGEISPNTQRRGTPEHLLLDHSERAALWAQAISVVEDHIEQLELGRVSRRAGPDTVREALSRFDFDVPITPAEAVKLTAAGLTEHQTQAAHPMYFGLFVPAPTTMGIAGELLSAAFNPQLAALSHSPFAIQAEQHLITQISRRIGFGQDPEGIFTAGGSEGNSIALQAALFSSHPNVRNQGVRGVQHQLAVYSSAECHGSVIRAARISGLGDQCVRLVRADRHQRLDLKALERAIRQDRMGGVVPLLIIGTAGTTSSGSIDDLAGIAAIARQENAWFHVDGAWGAAAAIAPKMKSHFAGLDQADSLTLDAHKWLSVPMGCGIFLTRRRGSLAQAFDIEAAYMPREPEMTGLLEPYRHSPQWSRRFMGLKLLLSLAVAGWDGYAAAISRQVELGNRLRALLTKRNWLVVNDSALPVICFIDGKRPRDRSRKYLETIADKVVDSGSAWLNVVRLSHGGWALRAAISNLRTSDDHAAQLVDLLDQARTEIGS